MPIKFTLDKLTAFQKWLFFGTRSVEFLNFVFMVGFSADMLFYAESIAALPSYSKFDMVYPYIWWIAMFIIGWFQLYVTLRKTNRSNQGSGFVLLVCGAIWFYIGATFYATAPPVITAVPTYFAFAVICELAGLFLLRINKDIEREQNTKTLEK